MDNSRPGKPSSNPFAVYIITIIIVIALFFFTGVKKELGIKLSFQGDAPPELTAVALDKHGKEIEPYVITPVQGSNYFNSEGFNALNFWLPADGARKIIIRSNNVSFDKLAGIETFFENSSYKPQFTLSNSSDAVSLDIPISKTISSAARSGGILILVFLLVLIQLKLASGTSRTRAIKVFFKKNRRSLFYALLITLASSSLMALFVKKTFSPFSIEIAGKLPKDAFQVSVDSGEGFSEKEKFFFAGYQIDNNSSLPNILEIINASPRQERPEVFIGKIQYNHRQLDLNQLSQTNSVGMVNGNLFLKPGEKISVPGFMQSFTLDLIKHPSSGRIAVNYNGYPLAVEDLHASRQYYYSLQFEGHSIRNTASGIRIDVPFWNLPVKNLKISSFNPDFTPSIMSATLDTTEGKSTTAEITRLGDELLLTPQNPSFNSSVSNFQLLCCGLFSAIIFYCSFLLQLFMNSAWKKENFSLPAFYISFICISCCLSGILLDCMPGFYTADSFITSQVENGIISNYKPLFYTLYLAVITYFSSHPALPVLTQILLFSMVISALIAVCIKSNIAKIFFALSLCIVLAFPVIPLYLNTLWKDVPYSIGILAVGLLIFICSRSRQKLQGKQLLVLGVILPVTVFTAGLRHNGLFLPLAVAAALYCSSACSLRSSINFIISSLIISKVLMLSFSLITGSEDRTPYKRLKLFPYIAYASYIPWQEYLNSMQSEQAQTIEARLLPIAKVEYQTGVNLMFDNNKVNLLASDQEIKQFNSEVRKAILNNFPAFTANLIKANFQLLAGKGYIWDEGYLPLRNAYNYQQGNFYYRGAYLISPHKLVAFGSWIKDGCKKLLGIQNKLPVLGLAFSCLPVILILLISACMRGRLRNTALFSLLALLSYAGIFIMPASLEYRYGFHLIMCVLVLPLLAGYELKQRSA